MFIYSLPSKNRCSVALRFCVAICTALATLLFLVSGMCNSDCDDGFRAARADNCPLMNVFWNPCDINHDLKVDMKDIGTSARAFGTLGGDPYWNPHADITGPADVPDGKVDMRDISLIARHFMEHYP